jgi:DNA-binding XRE family transcriptional regulator
MKNKKNNIGKITDFDEYLVKELKNPEAKKLFDEYGRQLDLAYQILQLRKIRNMSQSELAEKIGSTQSNIARLESGRQNISISLLGKVADALNAKLQIGLIV